MTVNRDLDLYTEIVAVLAVNDDEVILRLSNGPDHMPDSAFADIALEFELPWTGKVHTEGLTITMSVAHGQKANLQSIANALSQLFGHPIVLQIESQF